MDDFDAGEELGEELAVYPRRKANRIVGLVLGLICLAGGGALALTVLGNDRMKEAGPVLLGLAGFAGLAGLGVLLYFFLSPSSDLHIYEAGLRVGVGRSVRTFGWEDIVHVKNRSQNLVGMGVPVTVVEYVFRTADGSRFVIDNRYRDHLELIKDLCHLVKENQPDLEIEGPGGFTHEQRRRMAKSSARARKRSG